MQQMQLWVFWAIVAAFIVCGCILTRKPTKTLPTKTLEPAVPDERTGSGATELPVKEVKPST
jgi:hypothetical protein